MPDLIEIPITFDREGYEKFIECKKLPKYEVRGNTVFTDEQSFNYVFQGGKIDALKCKTNPALLFDYQLDIVDKALHRKRYAPFLDCGLGKTRIELAWANSISERVIYQCPLAVMADIMAEAETMGIGVSNLRTGKWDEKIGLINYEAMREIDMRGVKGGILDESSILKNGDGAIREYLTDLFSGLEYRMAASATPSPNDQSEYATHSMFLGYSASLKEFYSRFFRKEGTDWELKAHATNAFYHHLASWACYIKSPSKLGYQRGGELDHEPEYVTLDCDDTGYMPDGSMFAVNMSLGDAGKVFGAFRADTETDRFEKSCNAVKGKRAIVWCSRNAEEDAYRSELKGTVINGSTPEEKRIEIINAFRSGEITKLISKPKVLGFGVNIQQAECHLFSGYDFSFEKFYQAVRRSHRFGRKGRLKVFIPLAECERPIWESLSKKLKTFDRDCEQLQNRFFQ